MNPAETLEMIHYLQELKRQGQTMVIIEHKLPLVTQVADLVLVMDEGRRIAQDLPHRIAHDPQVIAAYLGTHPVPGGTHELTPAVS
jgi:branched-chain amino acid transport system ATP-binding protein